jgi:hypothetical protein
MLAREVFASSGSAISSAAASLSSAVACPASSASEKLQELGAIQAGGADNLVERPLGQVAAVHRDDDPMSVIGVPEDVVAPLDPIQLPAAALQRADRLAWRDRREPRRHAATVTRSISTGPGIGSPCATSDSM